MKTTTNFCIAAVVAVSINTLWMSPAKAQWDPACPHQHARPAVANEPNTRCVYQQFNPFNATQTIEQARKAFKGKKDEVFDPSKVHLNIFGTVPWVTQGGVKIQRGSGSFKGVTPSAATAMGAGAVGHGVNNAMGGVAGAMKK